MLVMATGPVLRSLQWLVRSFQIDTLANPLSERIGSATEVFASLMWVGVAMLLLEHGRQIAAIIAAEGAEK